MAKDALQEIIGGWAKWYPIEKIYRMWRDEDLTRKELFTLTAYNFNLFVDLILDFPYTFSPNQRLIGEVFYNPANGYVELIEVCGRKSAKTDRASAFVLFQVYRLLVIPSKIRRQFFGFIKGKPIFAVNVGPSEKEGLHVGFGTIKSLIDSSYLRRFKKDEKRGEIRFPDNIVIHCQTSSARSVRGFGNIINLYDEMAHFIDTHGNLSGDEIYYANNPNLKPLVPLARSIGISSPAGKQGIFWELFKKGNPVRVIQDTAEHGEEPWRAVFQFKTWEMNPRLPLESPTMQQEFKRNPDNFRMEYGAEFCNVIDQAVPFARAVLCAGGSRENGFQNIGFSVTDKKTLRIVAADPAYAKDAYAIAMGHLEGETVVIDLIKYFKPKFIGSKKQEVDIPEVEDYIRDLCKRFYVRYVVLDSYQSASTIKNFRKEGINAYEIPPKGISKSKWNQMAYELTLDRIRLGPEKIRFPWNETLLNEFQFLRRKVTSTNVRYEAAKDSSDDGTDCVARVVMMLEQFGRRRMPRIGWEK